MMFYTKVLFLGLAVATFAPSLLAAGSTAVLSCYDLDKTHRELKELYVIKEADGRYFYRATKCHTMYVRYCMFVSSDDYETSGYVDVQSEEGHAPNLFGDGNISIYPAGDIAYVINDAKSKVQFLIRTDKCALVPGNF